MIRWFRHGIVFLLLGLLAACSGEPKTGPVEVKWDRDTCVRCSMALSAASRLGASGVMPAMWYMDTAPEVFS